MFRRDSPVARLVVLTLLLLALLLSAALGAINYLSDRARLQDELLTSLRVQADQLAASLALPVWNFDQPQINRIAESVLQDRQAAGILIRMNDLSSRTGFKTYGLLRDPAGAIRPVNADAAPPAAHLFEERPLLANGDPVGSVKVFYTPFFMEQELRKHLRDQVITFLAFSIILTATLYLLLWRTILRPLKLIEQYAGQVSSGDAAQLSPSRPFRGELDRLRASLQKMVELRASRYAALQHNKAMLSAVLNSTPQFIFWKDLESRYMGCNQPFARLAGLDHPDLVVGKTDLDLHWPHQDSEYYRASDRQVMDSALPMKRQRELRTNDGQKLTVEATKIPLKDAAGKVYGVLGVFEDISARLAAERRLNDQLHFEEFVARLSSELVAAEPGNLQPLLTRALQDIARLFDADRVILGRTDEATGDLVAHAHVRRAGPPVPDRLPLSVHFPDLWLRLRAGQNVFVPSVADLLPHQAVDRARFEEVGIHSQIAAPVLVDGRLQYLLGIASIGRRAAWSDETGARIKVLAQLLATTALRCEAEEVVRASERQFRIFIEQAPVPILLAPSPDGAPLYFNPAFTRAFGFTRDDIRRPEDWWQQIYPDPAYRAIRYAAWQRVVARLAESGGFQDSDEAEMHTKSGAVRFAQVRVSMVEGYRMSFLNDLTDRRQAETALRLTQYAVDHNPVMIFLTDLDGRFVYANEAACFRFGYTPAQILQLHIWDIAQTVAPQTWPERSAMLRQNRSTTLESVFLSRNGDSFPVEARIQFVEFAGIRQFFTFATDITDRKAAQEAQHAYTLRIQKLATELTRAEERQRRELATILHDGVGQNLFAATTQLLTLRAGGDTARPEVERALSLLDQVTRDTRELTFELCPPVLYQLGLMPALQRLAEQFSARYHIPCTVTGTTPGPEDLNARGLAYQAVRELLNNIAKHARAQHVALAAEEIEGRVSLQITDDGAGFDPALLRPGATRATGFGLFHLRERLELLGGNLAIDSAPARGTRVQFSLPLHIP